MTINATAIVDDRQNPNGNFPFRFPRESDFDAPVTVLSQPAWMVALSTDGPYFPSVVDMRKTGVAAPADAFYLFYVTDHGPDSPGTGLGVAHAPSVRGPWTHYDTGGGAGDEAIFADPSHGNGYLGAGSVVFDAATATFYCQWHQKGTPGTATEVYHATSPDGLDWTYQGKWLDVEHPYIGTHRHNSYGRIHPLGDGSAIQIHSAGEDYYTHDVLQFCPDLSAGKWFLDGRRIGCDHVERKTSQYRSQVLSPASLVVVDGQLWLIHCQRDFEPTLFLNPEIFGTPWRSDWRGPAGPTRKLVSRNNDAADATGCNSPFALVHDDRLHLWYAANSSGIRSSSIRYTSASLRSPK
jgi:hypothetical protein